MPELNFNDASWEPSWLSLNGWIYPTRWTNADNEFKNAIRTAYQEASLAVGRLGPQIGEMQRLVEDWTEMLAEYRRTISYREADTVLEVLKDILDQAQQQYEEDRLLIAAKKKPAAPVTSPATKRSDPTPSGSDMSDDLAFASAMMGYSKQTARKQPSKVKVVPKPYVPPTPAEVWRDRQRKMATECDNGIGYGAHAVDQASVLALLGLAATDRSIFQYRAGPENSHVRIMRSTTQQFWTKGISHEAERIAGRYMVYRRVNDSSVFQYVSGQRHPEEYP
jgi:hypothetical protein